MSAKHPNALLETVRRFRESPPEVAREWLAKREVAAVLRRYAHALLESPAREDTLANLAELLQERIQDLTDPGGPLPKPERAIGSVAPGMDDFLDRSPIAGFSNPMAAPATLEIDLDGGRVVGEVRFGKAFEGAPGCVHGGFVAALMDEALGMATIFSGSLGMTIELTTRYLRPTPVDSLLRIEAQMDSADERRIEASGRILREGTALAEASACFAVVGTRKFDDLAADADR